MENNLMTISMIKGKEYQLKIVDLNSDLHEDFFYNVYKDALKQVECITLENVFLESNDSSLTESSNNIIAFCGERGQGKSSAMLSFSKILANIDNENVVSWFKDMNINRKLFKSNFHVLERIEPTELESCHNVLSIIISRMFFNFKNRVEIENNKNIELRNKLIDLFRNCYQDINTISSCGTNLNEYEPYDDLEQLAILSDAANIKSDFARLVNYYLEYMYDKTQENYLVIQIDDTDLNGINTYSIVEAVRKYFMIPNVIILMAANLNLLIKSIENHFVKYWGNKAFNKVTYKYHPQDAYKMARQYVDKLFPGLRKINLPNLFIDDSNSLKTQITIKYLDVENNKNIFDFNDVKGTPLKEINDIILRYIYEKTGLIFIRPDDQLHKIIPRNTRALANFLSVLNSMDNVKTIVSLKDINNNDVELRIHNLEKFEEYFVNNWIEENVDNTLLGYIEDWFKASWKEKNKVLIYLLENELFRDNSFSTIETHSNHLLKNTAVNHYRGKKSINSYTYADIIDELKYIDNNFPEGVARNFSFAIKVLYDILLSKKFYNQVLSECTFENLGRESNNDMVNLIGPVLSDSINKIIPKTKSNRSRTRFDSILPKDLFEKHITNNTCAMYFTALFGDIKNSTIESVTNTENTIEYVFEASQPFVRLLQPFSYIKNLDETFEVTDEVKNNIFISRYASFLALANTDLLDKIERSLSNKKYLSSESRNSDYFKVLFERIEGCFKEIKYIDFSYLNYNWLMKQIDGSTDWISKIFESASLREDKKSLVEDTTQKLQTFEKTYTIDLLKSRVDSTLRQFYLIARAFPMIDLKFEISELENINNRIGLRTKLSKKTCLNHQTTINKMIKITKEKLEEFKI